MKKHLNIGAKILAYILVHYLIMTTYLVVALGFYTIYSSISGIDDIDVYNQFLINQLMWAVVVAAFFSFIIYYLLFRNQKQSLFVISNFKRFTVKQGILASLIGASLVFFSSIIVYIMSLISPNAYQDFIDSVSEIENASTLSVVMAVVIAAPFIEEVIFRGITFYFLKKHYSTKVALIVQALLFGVYHMNLVQGSYAAALGIILGLSLIWTGSIWIPIIIHFANNFMSYLMGTELAEQWLFSDETTYYVFVVGMLFFVLPVSILYLYKDYKKNSHLVAESEESVLIWDKEPFDFE